jgi:LacI family transcriptional regulator
MSVTIVDVAREAGVSRTTVSNVFNNRAKCSEATRLAVLEAARKLGYKPNLVAKALITNRTRLIGLILPSYVDRNTLTSSPFYNIILDGIYATLRSELYYDLIIFSVSSQDGLVQVSDWIDARRVDGILAIGEYEERFLRELDAKGIPVVLIDNYAPASYAHLSYVNSDDLTGGYLATRKLIGGGYQRIALCSVAFHSPLMQRRYEGYRKAIQESGQEEHIFERNGLPFEAGLQLVEALLEHQIEAAFCTEDMLAIGLLHGLLQKNVHVGAEFGLVGFDHLHFSRQVYPPLTTIDQNIFEKGEAATRMLLDIINQKTSAGSRLILPVRLIERATAR